MLVHPTRIVLAVALAIAMSAAVAEQSALSAKDVAAPEETCGEFGTSVIFADSPIAASKQALKEEKLVFVLHVSGHFEVPDYT